MQFYLTEIKHKYANIHIYTAMPIWDAVCKGKEEQGDFTKPQLNGAVSAFTVYLHWESDSLHLLPTHFQKFEQFCGVVCAVSVSPDAKHLGLLLPMHSSENVIIVTFLVNSPVSTG